MIRAWMRADEMSGRTIGGKMELMMIILAPIQLFFWPFVKMFLMRLEEKTWRSWRVARGLTVWVGVCVIMGGAYWFGHELVALYVVAIQIAIGALVIWCDS